MTRRACTRILAALCGCLPLAAALAQGAVRPVDALIVNPIGTLSDGTPDLVLPRPVRIDFTAPSSPLFIAVQVCSSGIAAISEACGGDVYLVGTPVN